MGSDSTQFQPHALNGANLLLNLSASNEVVGKAAYRKSLVAGQSAKCIAAYLYASSGSSESTTDLVFGGHAIIAENGTLLQEDRMNLQETLLIQDIDIERLMNDRRKINSFMGNVERHDYQTVIFQLHHAAAAQEAENETTDFRRKVDPKPFVPAETQTREQSCSDIFTIQATGLAQRLNKTGIKKAVLGISGGLDSTLALLVTYHAYKQLQRPAKDIIGVTMPGFGDIQSHLH